LRLGVNPVRNSSGALNPAGIILKSNPAAEQRGIISNGVNERVQDRVGKMGCDGDNIFIKPDLFYFKKTFQKPS